MTLDVLMRLKLHLPTHKRGSNGDVYQKWARYWRFFEWLTKERDMASKFNDFLTEKHIDPRRVLAASKKIERLRAEDRSIRLKERTARRSEDGMPEEMKKNRVKPRSGRPVTKPAMQAALEGLPLTGPQKTRLLRAVNHVLHVKKLDAVGVCTLF